MTVGQGFPVVGPGGEVEWWVVNRPAPGGPRGPQITNYVVVSTRGGAVPVNKVAGPFSTQAQAVAWQTSANTAGNSPGSAIGGLVNASGLNPLSGLSGLGDLAHRLTESSTWIRVGEFIVGGLLLFVAAKAFFPGTVNTVTSGVKKAGKAALL